MSAASTSVVTSAPAGAAAAPAAAAKVDVSIPADWGVAELAALLLDDSQPIARRMRACFVLRQTGGPKAIEALAAAMGSSSVLLGHEIAFVLGQMQDVYAVPFLTRALQNTEFNPIVRHEAAEALGAIGLPESYPILVEYSKEPHPIEVRETCELALERIQWAKEQKERKEAADSGAAFVSPYNTVDPAPALKEKDPSKLQAIMCNTELSHFKRYKAMFALRNLNTEAAVLALAAGFTDSSAVFRHEIAYVMGQLQHPASVPSLSKVLRDVSEHAMVRHEAAEALGSIGGRGVPELLTEFQRDSSRIVGESCDVAQAINDDNTGSTSDDDEDEAKK